MINLMWQEQNNQIIVSVFGEESFRMFIKLFQGFDYTRISQILQIYFIIDEDLQQILNFIFKSFRIRGHTIYSQSKKMSKSFTFIPRIQQGKNKKKELIYKNSKQSFFKLQTPQRGKKFTKKTVEQDIALLFLDKPLDFDDYPKVGWSITERNKEIQIIGYPSEAYANVGDINAAYFKRDVVKGKILDIEDTIIYHNLDTKTGHSGGPIISKSGDDSPIIIGVHTHKGSLRNFGVFLNEKILQRLIKYEIQFAWAHEDYKLSIKFPQNLRFRVLSQQSYDIREKVLPSKELFDFERLIPHKRDIILSNDIKFVKEFLIKLDDQQSQQQYSSFIENKVQSDQEKALKSSLQKIVVLHYQNNRLIDQKSVPQNRYSLYYSYLKHNGRILQVIRKMIETELSKLHQNRDDFLRTIKNNYNETNQLFDFLYKKLQKNLGNPIPPFNIVFGSNQNISPVQEHLKKVNEQETYQTQIQEQNISSQIDVVYEQQTFVQIKQNGEKSDQQSQENSQRVYMEKLTY